MKVSAGFVLMFVCATALAHEVRPAYLELHQTAADRYDVLFKVPGRGNAERLGIYVELPSDTSNVTEPRGTFVNNAFTERWSIARPGGLDGSAIRISGLESTNTDALARVERLDGTTQVARMTPTAPSFIVDATPRATQVAGTYLLLGVEHILLGVDHLLFVLALLILVKGVGRLIATVTAFTVAHSLTLAAATLGLVDVPGPPVEAAIALSIVFVAAEIIRARSGRPGLTERYPWVVAFTFGLLHGFGFASALRDVGLPQTAIPIALLFFNVGVEIGQLLFIALVLAMIAIGRKATRRFVLDAPKWLWRVPPYTIGGVASFWVVQRLVAF